MTGFLILAGIASTVVLPDPAGTMVPITDTGEGLLFTDGRRCGLYILHEDGGADVISEEPGAGGNVVFTGEGILFKECPAEDEQRVVFISRSGERTMLFENAFFSGPFPAGGSSFLIALEDRAVEIDMYGDPLRQWAIDGFPASMVLAEERPVQTLEEGGISILDSHRDRVFTRLSPGPDDMVLAEMSPRGFLVFGPDREVLAEEPSGLTSSWTERGSILYSELEYSGLYPVSGRVREMDPVTGTAVTISSGGVMTNPVYLKNGGYTWTEENGSLRGFGAAPEGRIGSRHSRVDPAAHFDVVYMHQRWDTPDWFNGSWSCGPTSCMMAVQYYIMLTPDSIWASYPSPGHWSLWGNYIPVEYTFLGYTYDDLGESPGGVLVPGAHGFICPDGAAVWNLMVEFLSRHEIYSAWAGTSWATLTQEIDAMHPVVCSSSVLGYGHIILFNGYYDDHTVVVNDPFGDANESGWGNYYNGKDVLYDWPGYNNGHVQIGVSQLFYARSQVPAEPDTLVDDCCGGFYKYGDCRYWHLTGSGYQGESWWTYSTGAPPDTCFAEWHPVLPFPGDYEVMVYIPPDRSTATGRYSIETLSGTEEILLDQGLYSDEWVSLGTFGLGGGSYLRLGDHTGTAGDYIAFDAALFSPAGTGTCGGRPEAVRTGIDLWPNPCSDFLRIGSMEVLGEALPEVYDTAGRLQLSGIPTDMAGPVTMDLSSLPPGIYIVRVSDAGGTVASGLLTICR
ncbi:MAG: hypothetical protein AVO35_02100 [Candidatus Aegiribacteria sp. MLS_C]|nr:MAG: hypothetical protein AVO35_02100 [Candidatus Aegiribacteria sp. MLS_C]